MIQINGTGDGNCTFILDGKPWCYIIGEASNCADKKRLPENDYELLRKMRYLGALTKDIFYSFDACKNANPKSSGLEEFIEGLDIIGQNRQIEIRTQTPEACQTECVTDQRCEAWTFMKDSNETKTPFNCFLKAGSVCDNTFRVRKRNAQAVSGFLCRFDKTRCWSTSGNFPKFCPHLPDNSDTWKVPVSDIAGAGGVACATCKASANETNHSQGTVRKRDFNVSLQ